MGNLGKRRIKKAAMSHSQSSKISTKNQPCLQPTDRNLPTVNINLADVTMDLANVVCVETEQFLFPMKKPPKEDKDLVSTASNGGFPRYPKCKVFASFLSIREKGGCYSILFHQPASRPKYAILADLENQSVTLTGIITPPPASLPEWVKP